MLIFCIESLCKFFAIVPKLDLNFDLINFENLARQVANLDISQFKPDVNDEETEREKFFTNLMMFKTSVLDFVIKSIFLFSEFNFEEDDIDDTMVDFVYIQFFREMFRKDFEIKKENPDFMALPMSKKTEFEDNVQLDKFISANSYIRITGMGQPSSKQDAVIDNIKEKIDESRIGITDLNLTYDVAQALLFFYNSNNPNNTTESFCEAVRILIRKEISNLSKALKDIVYTNRQKQAKTFNIEDRFLEKKLNILPYKAHQALKFPKITEEDKFGPYVAASVENFCNQIPTYHHPYFRSTQEADNYIRNYKLANTVQSQMGGDAYLFTRFSEFDLANNKAEVEIISCFFDTSVNEASDTVKNNLKSYTVKEQDLASNIYEARSAKGIIPSRTYSAKAVNTVVDDIYRKMYLTTADPQRIRILAHLSHSNLLKEHPNIESRIDRAFGNAKISIGSSTYTYGQFVKLHTGQNPYNIIAVRDEFNRRYEDVWLWGTLKDSLEDEMNTEEKRQIAFDILSSAEKYVNQTSGIANPAKFIDFDTTKEPDPAVNFSLEKSAEKGYRKMEANVIETATKDSLYPNNFRTITFGNYPFTPLSQFHRRGAGDFLIDDYKHRGPSEAKSAGTLQTPPVLTETTLNALTPQINNQYVLDIFKKARQRITPDSISLIGKFRERKVYYNPIPVAKISLDLSNYKDFKDNFRKEYKKDATEQDYIDICLKPQIIDEFKKKNIITEEYYRNSFPIKKLLSHVSCNMNNYVEMINNIEPQTGAIMPKRIITVKSLNDLSLFNTQNLLALGGGLAGLSLSQAQSIVRSNSNFSAADIISMTNSFDFTTYFIKTSIRNYLSIIEQSDLNIKVSKGQANIIGNALRQIYSKATKIADSANKIGAIFGADTAGKGLPSQQQLVQDFRGLKLLFNPPTTPFAIANFWAGVPPTSGFSNWITYLILEPLLLAIELSEDAGLLEELKNALFDGDNDNSFAAPEKNLKDACETAKLTRLLLNPVVPDENNQKTRKTSGGEYLLPDGKRYVGEYHVHNDGTAMSLGKHENESIILTPILERDDL